jgi:hypothetical protein
MKKPVPEFIDPDFAKTSPKRSVSVIQNGRFGLAFAKTGSIISATDVENLLSDSVPRAQKKETQARANCSAVPTQLALCLRLAIDL